MNDKFSIFLPITKVDVEKRLVYLRAAQEVIDRAGEKMDYDASRPYFEKWSAEQFDASGGKSYGNVRAMHDPKSASGIIAEPLSFDDLEKAIDAVVYVSDDQDWRKCQDGTFTGASIGGSYLPGSIKVEKTDDGATYKKYTAVPNHLALVDRPCIPTATFQLVKADGSIEVKAFNGSSLLTPDPRPETHDPLDKGASPGERKYGDVKFADAANKKYPIDTEAHIRAAWNYINKEKNAGKYSAEDLKTIKSKIVAAWKDKIDKDGPPSASAEKASGAGNLIKSDSSAANNLNAGSGPATGTGGDMKKIIIIGNLEKLDAGTAPDLSRTLAYKAFSALSKCCGSYGSQIDWGATSEVFDVMKALSALSQISALIQSERSEDHEESAAQLQSLTDALLALKDFISSEIQEVQGLPGDGTAPTITMNRSDATGDLLKIELGESAWEVPMADIIALDPGAPLAKIGAKHSKEDLSKIQAIHDHAASLGATCSTEKADQAADLTKVEQASSPVATGSDASAHILAKIDDALAKLATTQEDLTKAHDTISALEKRITEMEDAPAEGKAFLKAVTVSKEEDSAKLGKTAGSTAPTEDELQKLDALDRRLAKEGNIPLDDLAKMSADQKATALMKLAHQSPADASNGSGMNQ